MDLDGSFYIDRLSSIYIKMSRSIENTSPLKILDSSLACMLVPNSSTVVNGLKDSLMQGAGKSLGVSR